MVVINNSPNPDAAFIIDPASVGSGVVGPNPLAHAGGQGLTDRKHRSATVFVATPGDFDLKYATTGQAVCRISIE